MHATPVTNQAYELLHRGILTLSDIEGNGMAVDRKYLEKTKEHLRAQSAKLAEELRGGEIWEAWKRRFGASAKLTSPDQLGEVLFKILKYECTEFTESGKPSTEEDALDKLEHPWIAKFVRMKKYLKAESTYLDGILRETMDDGVLHPVFNLHIARTYRSSSDSPNFQNMPVRDPEIGRLVRRAFRSRFKDGVIVENDFKGIEVVIAACYHKDPTMISYIKDPTKDMHRDMAMQIFKLKQEEVEKTTRYASKNGFVFPEFYGNWWKAVARDLWDMTRRLNLKLPDGTKMRDHLKNQGIRELGSCGEKEDPRPGTFEYHLKKVEQDFWGRRFKVYDRWKKQWFESYQKKGYFDTLTGFRIGGVLNRKQVINYPVQGSAFHCLLWSLVRVNETLRRYKFRGLLCGQIHDSMIGDLPEKELDDYLEIVDHVVTVLLPKAFPWISLPLVIECEVCPQGTTWFDKKEVHLKSPGLYEFKGARLQGAAALLDALYEDYENARNKN